jgi:putative ATP-dependent endonuclease of OLD family
LDDPLSSEKTRKSLSSDRVSYVLPSEVRSTLVTCLDSWNLVAPFRNPEERGEFGANPSLASTGENLTTYLQSIREDGTERYPDICGTYIDIMEGVTDLRIVTERDQHGDAAPFIRIDEENSEGIGLEALSSGAKEILILISQIVDSRMDNGPLYIEEPELHLHPAAEREIYSIIKETVEDHGSQVFVTTHSDIIVDEVDIGDVYFVNRDVYTSIDTVEEGELGRVLTNIGYSKSELLQAERVVFVEGRSDRVVLLNWAKVLNNSFSENGVHVKKFDGDEIYEDDNPYANEIPDLLGQLGIPYKFIFDSDEKQPEDKEEHIITNIGISPSKIHVLNRYCIESYLADSPGSIADVLSVSIEMVEGELPENPSETNMKSWFNDMFKSELSTGYSQEKHGALLAKNMEGHEIDAEMHELIDEITEMEGRR